MVALFDRFSSRAPCFAFSVIFWLPFSKDRDNVSLLVVDRSCFLVACLLDFVISYFFGLCIVCVWPVSSRARCFDFSMDLVAFFYGS